MGVFFELFAGEGEAFVEVGGGCGFPEGDEVVTDVISEVVIFLIGRVCAEGDVGLIEEVEDVGFGEGH